MSDAATSVVSPPPTRDLSPRGYAVALALLLLVTIGAFSPVLRAGLLGWDDQQTIARNPLLQPPGFESIAYYLRHSHMHLYVPATYAAWTVLAMLAERPDGTLSPLPFHAANLLVHLSTILVVAAVLRRLTFRRVVVVLAAAVVALHPIQVEAVAWASGFKDVASTLLIFLAALAWTRTTGPAGARWATLATIVYVVALFTKPTAIVTPAIAWLLCVAIGEGGRPAALRLIPWLVLAVPVALIGRSVQPPSHGDVAAFHLRPLLALDAIGWYAKTLLWPATLAVDQGRTPSRVLGGHVPLLGSIVGLIALAATAAVAARSAATRRPATIGGAIALVALAPVLGLVPFDFQAISGVAEHYVYPAVPGVALVIAALVARRSVALLLAAAVLFAGVAAPVTFRQARTWLDDDRLFSQVQKVNPASWIAASAYSFRALEGGDAAEAERWAQRSIELNDKSPNGWANLAAAQARRGDADAAVASLAQAYGIEPNNAIVNMNLGGLLAERGAFQLAYPLLESATQLDPTNATAHVNFALVLRQLGKSEEAVRHLDVAVRLAPGDASARVARASAYLDLGRGGLARRDALAALAIKPDLESAREILRELDAATTRAAP